MSREFYKEYLTTTDRHERMLLFGMNPNKFDVCRYLIKVLSPLSPDAPPVSLSLFLSLSLSLFALNYALN